MNEVSIDISELRKRKIFIATPMYGGMCNGAYTKSLCDFMVMCTKYGIEAKLFFIFNPSNYAFCFFCRLFKISLGNPYMKILDLTKLLLRMPL